MLFKPRDYWWIYLMQDGVAWAHCKGSETTPKVNYADNSADVPVSPGEKILLCVPGEHVRIHRLVLPARNRRQFMTALPYALEDKLLRDTGEYHFVPLGKADTAGSISVAVTEHSRMNEWREVANANEWQVETLVPDYLMLSDQEEDCWLLDVSEFPALLARAEGGATFANSNTPADLLGALLLAMGSLSSLPGKIRIRTSNQVEGESLRVWQDQLEQRQIQGEFFSDGRSRHAWLASQGWPKAEYSLLRGEYASTGNNSVSRKSFLPAAVISLVLIALLTIYAALDYTYTKTRYEQLRVLIQQTYLEAFPNAKNIIDPRYQMEQKIEELKTRSSIDTVGLDFISWLESLSSVVASDSSYKIKNINYQDEKVVLDIEVPDYSSLERLQQMLSRRAKVSLEKGELRGEIVFGRIAIEVRR